MVERALRVGLGFDADDAALKAGLAATRGGRRERENHSHGRVSFDQAAWTRACSLAIWAQADSIPPACQPGR